MSHLLYVNCFDYRTIKVAYVEQASPVVEMGVLLYRRRLTESNLWCCKENYTILHTKIKVGTSIRMVLEHEFQRDS